MWWKVVDIVIQLTSFLVDMMRLLRYVLIVFDSLLQRSILCYSFVFTPRKIKLVYPHQRQYVIWASDREQWKVKNTIKVLAVPGCGMWVDVAKFGRRSSQSTLIKAGIRGGCFFVSTTIISSKVSHVSRPHRRMSRWRPALGARQKKANFYLQKTP